MFNRITTKKGSDALDVYTIKDVPPILLSIRPLEASRDEGFLIGRRELTGNVENRTHSHIRITEVAPSNSAIVNGEAKAVDTAWKVPVQLFTDKIQGKTEESKKLSKRIRSYYKAQDEMINAFENIQLDQFDTTTLEQGAILMKRAERLAQLSFVVNLLPEGHEYAEKHNYMMASHFTDYWRHLKAICVSSNTSNVQSSVAAQFLLVAKAVAVGLSSSIAIISSLVDSSVDLLSGILIWWSSRAMKKKDVYTYPEGILIWWSSRAMKKKDVYTYPEGRSRLEPTAIVVLSVVMSLASFQLIIASIQKIVDFTSKSGTIPTVELPVILIAASTVVLKFILFLLCHCFGRASSSVRALALDHRNDVVSNIVAIICGYFGSDQFKDQVGEYNVVYIDPIGAIIISVYILVSWWQTGYEQTKLLTGHTADPNFLSKITWICLNHHKDIALIETVRAFHFGNHFLVEVDIVLPEDMPLKDSHNIGETLQQKLEKFPLVERAFVHLDYEAEHHPHEEHKPI